MSINPAIAPNGDPIPGIIAIASSTVTIDFTIPPNTSPSLNLLNASTPSYAANPALATDPNARPAIFPAPFAIVFPLITPITFLIGAKTFPITAPRGLNTLPIPFITDYILPPIIDVAF